MPKNLDNMTTSIVDNTDALKNAEKKVKDLKSFYLHFTIYILANIIIVAMNVMIRIWEGESLYEAVVNFGTFIIPFFWGIGLLFHFLGVFGPDFIFGKSWEEKKIKEYMDKDKEEYQRFQ